MVNYKEFIRILAALMSRELNSGRESYSGLTKR